MGFIHAVGDANTKTEKKKGNRMMEALAAAPLLLARKAQRP